MNIMQKFLILFLLSTPILIQACYTAPKKSDDFRKSKTIKQLIELQKLTGKSCQAALDYLLDAPCYSEIQMVEKNKVPSKQDKTRRNN